MFGRDEKIIINVWMKIKKRVWVTAKNGQTKRENL